MCGKQHKSIEKLPKWTKGFKQWVFKLYLAYTISQASFLNLLLLVLYFRNQREPFLFLFSFCWLYVYHFCCFNYYSYYLVVLLSYSVSTNLFSFSFIIKPFMRMIRESRLGLTLITFAGMGEKLFLFIFDFCSLKPICHIYQLKFSFPNFAMYSSNTM